MRRPNQKSLFFSLNTLLRQLLRNNIELPRVTRTASLLLLGGATSNSMPQEIESRISAEQNVDGGWVGPDDTMWNLLYLKTIGKANYPLFKNGLAYLRRNLQGDLGWGRSDRDIPRIPVTGRILYFFPELRNPLALNGLLSLWSKENNSLTYKAASIIMACAASPDSALNQTVSDAWDWLRRQQNSDGGFGPWKNHPAGSDIYCTSYAILGLLRYQKDRAALSQTLKRALDWMARTQLSIGLWGYHQIEDGAAWGWYALNEVGRFGGYDNG